MFEILPEALSFNNIIILAHFGLTKLVAVIKELLRDQRMAPVVGTFILNTIGALLIVILILELCRCPVATQYLE
jgi:hypothetical protein